MKRRKRSFWLLVLGLLSLAGLAYLIIFYSPSQYFNVSSYRLSLVAFFFVLLLSFFFSFIAYFSHNIRRGALVGLLIITYLLFRMFNLESPFFIILLIALFITLELFFKKKI